MNNQGEEARSKRGIGKGSDGKMYHIMRIYCYSSWVKIVNNNLNLIEIVAFI